MGEKNYSKIYLSHMFNSLKYGFSYFERISLSIMKSDASGASSVNGSYTGRPIPDAPDLESRVLENRIVYVGMPLVSSVTELVIAELLYLQFRDRNAYISMYINSTGCTRADGERIGYDTEGSAIYDTMCYVKNEIHTISVGLSYGHACMLLAAGTKGKRSMLLHATAMLHQPKVLPTEQCQAADIENNWKNLLVQRDDFLKIISFRTGKSIEKICFDTQRPLYMQPKDALKYGIVDEIINDRVCKIISIKI